MTTIEKRFGKRVGELRQARGLSQEELAFRARVHRTYLGGIGRGERKPSLKNVTAIADALGLTLAELFQFNQGASRTRKA